MRSYRSNNNNEERNNINKDIKVYLITIRTRFNFKNIISEAILLTVENNLKTINLIRDTNIRTTTTDKYYSTYINTKSTIVFTTLRPKVYYDARYIFIFFNISIYINLRLYSYHKFSRILSEKIKL